MVFARRRWAGLLIAVCFCASVAGCASVVARCSGETRSSIGGEAPATRLAGGEHADMDISKAPCTPAGDVIELELGFATQNKAQFDEVMRQIQDKSSPRYHHWLTPEEMHEKFGESQAQFNEVEQWLVSQGFTITDKAYAQNEDYIRFKGTVADVEKTFMVRLYSPVYDRYMTNDDPAIPPQFVGVIGSVTGFAGLLQQ
jgi:hypothetical protein